MKRRILSAATVLMLVLALVIPAHAAVETQESRLGHVTDEAGLLTPDQRQQLAERAEAISEAHGVGIYIIALDDYRSYANGSIMDAGELIYRTCALGFGAEKRGLLLMLSMEDRDFTLTTYSDYGQYVFDQTTQEEMVDYFLDDFAADDWFGGFSDYLTVADAVLANGPQKLKKEIQADIGIILLIPLIPAAIGVAILGRKMKSVAAATQAAAYVSGVPELTVSEDRYTHTTEVRRKVKDNDSNTRSGGGTSSRSSGGFTSTSGKF